MKNDKLLEIALTAAVPLWIMRHESKPLDWLMSRKEICAQVIASKGDNILYKVKKVGATADAFNHLAEGIAILALIAKGGVMFGDLHFEHPHPSLRNDNAKSME